MSYILSIIYVILFNLINLSYIEIPFSIEDYIYGDGNSLILKYLYKGILVKFSVGSPFQNVHLSACLGEYSTFIISKNEDEYEKATYDKKLSKTYKQLSPEPESFYFQTFSEAIKSQDNFIIEDTNYHINNLAFYLATEIGDNNYCSFCEVITEPGILGLLIAQMKNFEENIYETNFINQLKNKNLISNYNFYFHFNSQNSGKIIIGSKPDEYSYEEKYKNLKYFTMKISVSNGDLDWSIKFDQIHYGNKKMEHIKPMILRNEFGLITGYSEWEKVLENEFFSKLINENKCFKNNTNELGMYLHFFYCYKNTDLSGFKQFTFTINEFNYNFTLTKEDLFLDIGDKYLFLMAFGGISELILGLPFIKKYQLVFNPNTKTIGFYKDEKEKNFSLIDVFRKYIIIISILSFILLCLIIVAILFFWNKKKNKKNATELLDEYDNDNKKKEKNKLIDEHSINIIKKIIP